MSIEEPYTLATLHKAASASQPKIYAGRTYTGASTSGREVVTAIDAQGVNVYNLRSNQVAISYSLSPSTKFHCSPVSHVDRETLMRRTYAALQNGQDDMRIQCWTENSTDSDTEVKSFAISSAVTGLHVLAGCVVVVFSDGSIQRLSVDLTDSLQIIEASAYAPTASIVVSCHNIMPLADAEEAELRLIAQASSTIMYHIKLSTSADVASSGTGYYESQITLPSTFSHVKTITADIGSLGQLALLCSTTNRLELLAFDASRQFTGSLQVDEAARANSALTWLNETEIVLSTPISVQILDLSYSTIQSSLPLQVAHIWLGLVPQKSSKISPETSRALIVLATEQEIRLASISFPSRMNLLNAMGKQQVQQKHKESWIQDVPIQSTWKDSIPAITNDARTCLEAVQKSKTSQDIDSIFETFLFSQAVTSQKSKSKSGKQKDVNGKPLTNGHVEKKVNGQVNGTIAKSSSATLDSYDTQHLNESLSVAFVSKLLRAILVDSAPRSKETALPERTLDFLFRRGLVSASTLSLAKIDLTTVLAAHPELIVRFVSDVSGLTPRDHISLVKGHLQDAQRLSKLLPAVMKQLDRFDDLLVIDAIKSELEQTHVEQLLRLLHAELQSRLEDPESPNTLTVSDEVLCATITKLLDTFGVTNFVFASDTMTLIRSLRPAVAQLIAQTELIASTSSCVSELLMKARLLETSSKAKAVEAAAIDQATKENPEPEARKKEMPLDKVKKQDKNQTARGKAFARVQGIGSLYTIETLQI